MSKRTASTGHGSLATGAVTALALTVQTGLAAVVGVIIARELGRTAETDGFFAAYGVFVVLALATMAVRLRCCRRSLAPATSAASRSRRPRTQRRSRIAAIFPNDSIFAIFVDINFNTQELGAIHVAGNVCVYRL